MIEDTAKTDERWLPVPEAPEYSISSYGRIQNPSGEFLTIVDGRAVVSRMGVRFRFNIKRIVRQLFPDVAEAELNLTGEIWKPIPNHPGYEISNCTRVRRLSKVTDHGQFGVKRSIAAKILKVSRNNGYLVAYLGVPNSRKASIFYIEKTLFQLFPELLPVIPSLSGEEWRDVIGYEGLYRVSNFGRIFSCARIIDDGRGRNRYIRARVRENGSDANGYPKVELARDGGTETLLVHRLVAEAFIPNPNGLAFVHHRDEDKSNARADNLEWISAGGNVRDWFDGRPHRIDATLVEAILAAGANGASPAEILASLPRKRKSRKMTG